VNNQTDSSLPVKVNNAYAGSSVRKAKRHAAMKHPRVPFGKLADELLE